MIATIARLLAGLFVSVLGSVVAAAVPLTSVEQACAQIGARLASVSAKDCLGAGLGTGQGASRRGLPLMYRDFLPGSARRTPFRVMLIGGIHGDEFSSVAIAFQWIQKLRTERLQPFHWRVIPVANPDGLLSPRATRVNAAGVDLNRNFATPDWQAKAHAYWKRVAKSDPRRFPGPASLSEPETRWITAQIREFRPDAIISIHAPYGVLDFDGPLDPPQRFGYLRLQPLGIYPGSLGNYTGIMLGVPTITLELPYAGILPTGAQSQRVWSDMLMWLEANLPKAGAPLYRRLDGSNPWPP